MTDARAATTVVDGWLPVPARSAFHTLEYRHIGAARDTAASAPVLVFAHEGLGCVSTWGEFPQALCERTGLAGFVYSRPGYGGSSPATLPRTPRYLHDEALDVLPAVLDAAGIARAILVGHSDGASIALIYAGSRAAEGRLQGLVLLAPHVFNEPACIRGVEAADAAWQTGKLSAVLRRFHGEQTDNAFSGWRDIWLSAKFRRWNIENCLPAITVPVLLLQGEDDEYGTPAQLDAIETGVGGRLDRPPLLAICGHQPHRDAAEQVLQAAAGFAATVLAPGASVGLRKHKRPRL